MLKKNQEMASKRSGKKILSSLPLQFSSSPSLTQVDLDEVFKKLSQHVDKKFEHFEGKIEEQFKKMEQRINDFEKEMQAKLQFAVQSLVSHIDRLDDRVDEGVLNLEKLETKIQDKIDLIQDEITMLQYKDMQYALRIRGLRENVQDLESEVINGIAPIIGYQPEDLFQDVEKIFRVNSQVAQQKNLPRDVVIYFNRKSIPNSIIQAFYANRFQIAKQDIIILKEIPPKILIRRKEYAFLSDELRKRQIKFRWDIPAGMVVNYTGKQYKLNTVLKAKDFYAQIVKAGSLTSMDNGNVEAVDSGLVGKVLDGQVARRHCQAAGVTARRQEPSPYPRIDGAITEVLQQLSQKKSQQQRSAWTLSGCRRELTQKTNTGLVQSGRVQSG